MFAVHDTARRLEDSLRDLEAGVRLVAPRWLGVQSAGRSPAGEPVWGVPPNLAHMAVYEELLAAPVLESLAAGGDGRDAAPSGSEDWFTREMLVLAEAPVEEILRRLRAARDRQIAVVRGFDAVAFNAPRTPLWGACWGGLQPAGWVATKTVQHTWEHGNSILQIALFAPR